MLLLFSQALVLVWSCSVSQVELCFFFFSSRRRHTRLVSDWSSDVCSSDLSFEPRGRGDSPGRNEGLQRAPSRCLSGGGGEQWRRKWLAGAVVAAAAVVAADRKSVV